MSEMTQRPKEDQDFDLDLGRVGLVIIIPVCCWAFYTTFQGLIDVMQKGPGDVAGFIGALVGSAAILSLMALSSWHLGTDAAAALAGRRRPGGSSMGGLFVLVPAFLFFFSLSAFFSYTYYHANFFSLSSRQIEGELQPYTLASRVISIVDEGIKAADKKLIDAILASSGAKEWGENLDALSKIAGEGGGQFERAFKDRQKQRQDEAKKIAETEAQRLKEAQAASQQIDRINSEIEDLQRKVAAANEVIEPQEREIARLKEEAAKETELARGSLHGLDVTKKAKCGPICLGHQQNAKNSLTAVAKIDGALNEHRVRRQEALKKINELTLKLPELKRVAQTAPATPAPRSAPSTGQTPDVRAELSILNDVRDRFAKNPSWANTREAEPSCKVILATARELNLAKGISPDFNCIIQSDETKRLLDQRDLFQRGAYNTECALTGKLGASMEEISARVRGNKIKPADALVEARKVVERCIDLAAELIGSVPAITSAREATEDFVRGRSLDRNRFLRAKEALWSFDPDARIALSVALAQDLLILIYKFLADFYKYSANPRRLTSIGPPVDLSDSDDLPPAIRARKALLRLAQPGRGDTSRILEDDIRAEGFPGAVETNLRGLLASLARGGGAWQIRDGVGLDNSMMREIENDLQGRSSARMGSVTGAVDAAQNSVDQTRFDSVSASSRLERSSAPAGTGPTPQDSGEVYAEASKPDGGRRGRRSFRELITRFEAAPREPANTAPRTNDVQESDSRSARQNPDTTGRPSDQENADEPKHTFGYARKAYMP